MPYEALLSASITSPFPVSPSSAAIAAKPSPSAPTRCAGPYYYFASVTCITLHLQLTWHPLPLVECPNPGPVK
eukprot:4912940-Amphidinium_carterae.1